MNTELEKIFKSVIKGNNFCTPDIYDYFRRGEYILEISEGRGIYCEYVVGVTDINETTMKRDIRLDKCYCYKERRNALNEALTYIDTLGL